MGPFKGSLVVGLADIGSEFACHLQGVCVGDRALGTLSSVAPVVSWLIHMLFP